MEGTCKESKCIEGCVNNEDAAEQKHTFSPSGGKTFPDSIPSSSPCQLVSTLQTHLDSIEKDPKCNGKQCTSSHMLGLLEEFKSLYENRLRRIDEVANKNEEEGAKELKLDVLRSWVMDLGEQNTVLVQTVEELEASASERVALLETKLQKTATSTKDYMVKLRDYEQQMQELIVNKAKSGLELLDLRKQLESLEEENLSLREHNANLQHDTDSLLKLINQTRETGSLDMDDLHFCDVTFEQLFGCPGSPGSRRSSQSPEEAAKDYRLQVLEEPQKKDSTLSDRSSFTDMQDGDWKVSKQDMKLMSNLKLLQKSREDLQLELSERDRLIGDLQSQITEANNEMAVKEAECNSYIWTLQGLRERQRNDSCEISRSEETIRQLREQIENMKKVDYLENKGTEDRRDVCHCCEPSAKSEKDTDVGLGESIIALQREIKTFQSERDKFKQESEHWRYEYTQKIQELERLKDEQEKKEQCNKDIQAVLTAEVAERHDQIVALREETRKQAVQNKEAQMQLSLKAKVIQELRKENKLFQAKVAHVESENQHVPAASQQNTQKEDKCVGTVERDVQGPSSTDNPQGEQGPSAQWEQQREWQQECQWERPQERQWEEWRREQEWKEELKIAQENLRKAQNQLEEKTTLLTELQVHLGVSRQEVSLKDSTLEKLEKKLYTLREDIANKDSNISQLEARIVELTAKFSTLEGQTSVMYSVSGNSMGELRIESDNLRLKLKAKETEVTNQQITIKNLQEALLAAKKELDERKRRLETDVSPAVVGMRSALPVNKGSILDV